MKKNELKIVFMGTPEFSASILDGLINDDYNIIAVLTEPDKPSGRDMKIGPTPVKKLALEKGIKVYQPEKKVEITEGIRELQPDLIIVAAYGKIISKETLDIPKYACINFHVSLLPELRGASPVQSAILLGLEKTGVTIMLMDEGMDTGPILTQVEIDLDKKENSNSLRGKMLNSGLKLLLETIPEYIDGKIKPQAQNNEKATYCKMIEKEDGHIDFGKSARDEERKIRAFDVWPGAFAFWGEKRIKIIDVDTCNNQELGIKNQELGSVFLDENKNLCIKFSDGYWIVNKIKMEGKKEMGGKDFLNGNREIVGTVLG